MLTQIQVAKRSREGVRRWYGENRDEYNALRRQRYAASKNVRNKARLRAANYRNRGGPARPIQRVLTRELGGAVVEVFSTGQVAALMDRSPQMLRNWEREGLIPASKFSDTHRLYTRKQTRMIVTLGRVLSRNGGNLDNLEIKKYIQSIKKRW